MVEGKRIWVQLLKRDRYERCVRHHLLHVSKRSDRAHRSLLPCIAVASSAYPCPTGPRCSAIWQPKAVRVDPDPTFALFPGLPRTVAVVYDRSDAVYGTRDPKSVLDAAQAKAQCVRCFSTLRSSLTERPQTLPPRDVVDQKQSL
jgi:hypothetical protein